MGKLHCNLPSCMGHNQGQRTEDHISRQLVISSGSSERDGLVLENATVYTENSESIYKAQVIYIPTKMENLIIELI